MARFSIAHTHLASFSPDLRTMVSVGDSTDVYIHEVIDGGRKFRKIATYSGKRIATALVIIVLRMQRPRTQDSRLRGVRMAANLQSPVKVSDRSFPDLLLKADVFRRSSDSVGSSIIPAPRHYVHLLDS